MNCGFRTLGRTTGICPTRQGGASPADTPLPVPSASYSRGFGSAFISQAGDAGHFPLPGTLVWQANIETNYTLVYDKMLTVHKYVKCEIKE
jgi:hypothetical protein